MANERFPFPQNPPQLRQVFSKLCKELPLEQLPEVRARVRSHMEKLVERASDGVLGPNLRVAKEVAAASEALLDQYETLDVAARELVIGAIFYFLAEKDLTHDHTPIVGFDDDARLLNHVLERLCCEGLFIEV